MTARSGARAAVAAAGIFATLGVTLVTLAVVNAVNAATPSSPSADGTEIEPPQSDLLKHLSLLYQGTYVLYGKGRRSERDLPVCSTAGEACNLAHKRYWLTHITERLCRCADRSECPLHFSGINDTLSQHVSNRAQLKFCNSITEDLPVCSDREPALKIKKLHRKASPFPTNVATKTEGTDTHSTLLCRCPWPNKWTLVQTTTPSATETILLYSCDQLPKCPSNGECGYIRADTLESYYSCSCPEQHICVFTRPQQAHVTSQLHFEGHAYTAKCLPN
ncbi:hypothetical protein SK128_026832 [Halocaridina rubra]|uniref:Uncharacterized protein n=1 Tax=Halocaridina rubra TaxID=373956 RepID=A0AAN8WVZ5_HALRR